MYKKIVPLVAVLSLSVAGLTFASDATVQSGSLNIASNTVKGNLAEGSALTSASGINFGSGTIDMDGANIEQTFDDYLRVDDNTGTNAGWNVKVSATDFVAENIDDPTTAVGTLTVTIPVSEVLKVNASNFEAVVGSITEDTAAVTADQFLSHDSLTVMSAAQGSGAGVYKSKLAYTLTLPKFLSNTTTIKPSEDNIDSPINDKDKDSLGLFHGTYETTITYSVAQEPQL